MLPTPDKTRKESATDKDTADGGKSDAKERGKYGRNGRTGGR
jgi:hypothetical protein